MTACSPAYLDLRSEARSHAFGLRGPPHLRRAVAATWKARMLNEHASARVFEALADQLDVAGEAAARVAACRSFADEERRHGVLCGAVVAAAGGQAVAPWPERESVPKHDDVTPRESALRNIMSVCCLAETVAVTLIGAERLSMPDGPLRALLTRIYSDEVGHARFGWLYLKGALPKLGAAAHERLSSYLRIAFGALERHELAHLPVGARAIEGGEALGLCDGRIGRQLFYDTVSDVIVPGLTALGLDAAGAWERRHSGWQGLNRP